MKLISLKNTNKDCDTPEQGTKPLQRWLLSKGTGAELTCRNQFGNIRLVVMLLVLLLLFSFLTLNKPIISYAENQVGTSAASMVTLEGNSGRVLFQKNADQKRPMASTTKIMTAITVLEHCKNIEKLVRVPKEAVGVEGSSIYLQYNEMLSIKALLYGLMLQSGNDCAVALAHTISGSVQNFAKDMNALAKKIGAKNSNFVNPHGLHNDDHYTTARDLALISAYAMKNQTFKEIVATKRYTTPWHGRDYDRVILNKNKILSKYQDGIGIKTGYTKKAGRCLVSAAERNGMQIISVVLNCGPMFEECMALMDRAFKSFVMSDIISEKVQLCQVKTEKSRKPLVKVGCMNNVLYPLTEAEKSKIRFEFDAETYLTAPVHFGTEVGVCKVFLNNQLLFTEKLYTIEEADPLSIRDYLEDLVRKWNQK